MTGRSPAVDITLAGGPAEILAGIIRAARGTAVPGATEALASLSGRRLAAELERGELALIEAARDDGAIWSQISAALGTRNRQTAQKRHADLGRRCPRPASLDIPEEHPAPGLPASGPRSRQSEAILPTGEDAPASAGQLQFPLAPAAGPGPGPAEPSPPPGSPVMSPGRRRPTRHPAPVLRRRDVG